MKKGFGLHRFSPENLKLSRAPSPRKFRVIMALCCQSWRKPKLLLACFQTAIQHRLALIAYSIRWPARKETCDAAQIALSDTALFADCFLTQHPHPGATARANGQGRFRTNIGFVLHIISLF